jgi:endonuclease YncB( thermonuclease family)
MKPNRRRPPLRHVVAAGAVAILAAVAATLSGGDRTREPAPGATPPLPPEATRPEATATNPMATVAPPAAETATAVRTVSGPGITPPPPAETPPMRVAPPVRPEPPPPPIVTRRLGLVKMEDAAQFSAGDIRVRLPGVAALGAEEVCRDRAGTPWPCGRRALAAVRAVVRGKTVDCPLPDKVKRGSFTTDCTLAGRDMAERIVASGWARALDPEGRLGAAERAAAAKSLGLHGDAAPIGVDPFPEPGDVPADRTTASLPGAGDGGGAVGPDAGAAANATR